MSRAIRKDVLDQVSELVAALKATFAVDRYPRFADGPTFEAELQRCEQLFALAKSAFQDYLMVSWSDEIATDVQRVRHEREAAHPAQGDTPRCPATSENGDRHAHPAR